MIQVKYHLSICTLNRYRWTSDDPEAERSLNRLTSYFPPHPLDPDPERSIFNNLSPMECFSEVLVFDPAYLGNDIDPLAFPDNPNRVACPFGDDVTPARADNEDQESAEYGVAEGTGIEGPA